MLLLAIEEVRNELGNTGNMSETTDEYDLMQVGLVDLWIMEDLLDKSRVNATEEDDIMCELRQMLFLW